MTPKPEPHTMVETLNAGEICNRIVVGTATS
jgi:hypothetical protein